MSALERPLLHRYKLKWDNIHTVLHNKNEKIFENKLLVLVCYGRCDYESDHI